MKRAIIVAAIWLTACAGQTGSVLVTVSGEEAVVGGFPVPDGPAFVDGWSMEFDTLVVALSDFELHGSDGEDALLEADTVIVDLTRGDATAWTFDGVGARRWEDVRYRLRPATADARALGEVDAAIRARMIDDGLAIYLEASATKGAIIRRLAWGFAIDVAHSRCVSGDGTDGLVVTGGGAPEAQITLHWDHLFFDSLALDDASMRLDAMSAVADDDGLVTLDALSDQRLADLRDAEGAPLVDGEGAPIVYDPGSTPLAEPTLRGMLDALVITVGHFQGEGHCDYAP